MQRYNEEQIKIISNIPDPATEFNPYFDIKSEYSKSSKKVSLFPNRFRNLMKRDTD